MSNIIMVSGTANEVAALALAEMRSGRMSRQDAKIAVCLAERRQWVKRRMVPTGSPYDYAVKLPSTGVDAFPNTAALPIDIEGHGRLLDTLEEVRERTTFGRFDIWFGEDGSAFISFEDHDDAVMFELAITGDRR